MSVYDPLPDFKFDDPYPDYPPKKKKRLRLRDVLCLIGAALVALGVIASVL